MKYKYTRKKIGVFMIMETDRAKLVNMLLQPAEWPQHRDEYWTVEGDGDVKCMSFSSEDEWDEDVKTFGNCFRTWKEATKARDKIKKLLNK